MRTYKPVKAKAPRGERIGQAVRLRAGGMSTRQIAREQGVSHQTVMRDLALWDEQQAKVVRLPGPKVPPRGGNGPVSRGENGPAEVTALRRIS